MDYILLGETKQHFNQSVVLKGWVYNYRSSGKIYFLQFRDGTGSIQAVISQEEVPAETWQTCKQITLESSVEISGKIKEEQRSPQGIEMQVENLKIIQRADDPYPIGKKSHSVDFLLNHRHLWVRSLKQQAILKIRDEVVWAIRSFFRQEGFTLTDTPILTPTSCEGTTTLFELDYFNDKAYLAQTGQLYLEALIYSLGKVYDFGPTFRAEKSKTRRHLTEFWMMDAEAAFVGHEENIKLQEKIISFIVKQVLTNRSKELELLERDIKPLEKIKTPFPIITYDEAVSTLQKKGFKIKWGDDFGGDEETALSEEFDQPVFIERYPAKMKAFYMKSDPDNEKVVLNDDLIAPEGYGEIIGGSQRIDDLKTLEQKLKEFNLPLKPFQWYVDLRKYGSVPHSGFGIGLERVVTWLCGLDHVREAIPFPRMLNRLNP